MDATTWIFWCTETKRTKRWMFTSNACPGTPGFLRPREPCSNLEAIGAFSKLTKAYPQDPLVPKSYFRAAQIFNDRLMNPEKAKKILNGLVKKYPDHDIIPFVQRYLLQMG